MRILFLTTVLPAPRRTGGEIATQGYIDAIRAAGHEVTVAGYTRTGEDYTPREGEVSVGYSYIETSSAGSLQTLRWLAKGILRGEPYVHAKFRSRQYPALARKLLAESKYDAIILDQCRLTWLFPYLPDNLLLICIVHNLEQEMYALLRDLAPGVFKRWIYNRESRLLKGVEKRLAERADQVWALTAHDGQWFARHGKTAVFQLPGGIKGAQDKAMPEVEMKFDVGMLGYWNWPPNWEGLAWFIEEVYPHLPATIRIRIAGKGCQQFAGKYPNLEIMGFVDDAETFLKEHRIIAIPSKSGGGVQIKTLDAIACGRRIVATPTAMRGIEDYPASVRVAETAKEFAETLLTVLQEDPSGEEFDLARQWLARRQQRFQQDVAEQLRALFESSS
ncbi:MAG: glycosyltransferase [Planctomycetes bacterium]|nr:glycosyltransferase [Planctomycetota bacterium]